MYVMDLAEYARVLLATTEMSFKIGWLRIQLILFCQLAGITGNRPDALVELRYQHLQITLIRDPTADRPRLFIELTPEFTKTYLGIKDKCVLSPFAYIALSYSSLLTKFEGTHSHSQKLSTIRPLYSALMSSCWACYLNPKLSRIQALTPRRSFIV
jgi:Protein of unknown function (DUF3435)